MNSQRAALIQTRDLACSRAAEAEQLNQLIPQQELRINQVTRQLSDITGNLAQTQGSAQQLELQTAALRHDLPFASRKEALEHAGNLTAQAAKIRQDLQSAEQAAQLHKTTLAALQGQAQVLQQQIASLPSLDPVTAREELLKLNHHRNQLRQELQQLNAHLQINRDIFRHVQEQSETLAACEARRTWLDALSNTANGRLNGKERIMLETYVQMTHFDRVLRFANLRLMRMTSGQYELIRRKEAANRHSYSGLDLDVLDHYNGTNRSVSSLSGGESFKASLALALGMSDAIQASAGGVRLETMFIDEGFGSLDDESLEAALAALHGLSDSNRLVGIISHVSALKERIDRKIVVTKDRSGGSRAVVLAD